jgi:hypothetical protein
MSTFVQRNYNLTEEEDFNNNIKPYIGKNEAATPAHSEEGEMVGWFIGQMYE